MVSIKCSYQKIALPFLQTKLERSLSENSLTLKLIKHKIYAYWSE